MSADDPAETTFPPPPWRSTGVMWAGLLRTAAPVAPPESLRPLLAPDKLAFMLIRYRAGTLRYDEFMAGVLARRGPRVGLWVHSIWVDSAASLWGGRKIWGVPKQLATFAWQDGAVEITDSRGTVATLSITGRQRRGMPIPLLAPGFGELDGRLLHFTGRLRARASRARIQVEAWCDELPPLADTSARMALTLADFHMTVPAGKALASARTSHRE